MLGEGLPCHLDHEVRRGEKRESAWLWPFVVCEAGVAAGFARRDRAIIGMPTRRDPKFRAPRGARATALVPPAPARAAFRFLREPLRYSGTTLAPHLLYA